MSLNPFYFRAGLLPDQCAKDSRAVGLNPFYFRAGLLLTVWYHPEGTAES